LRKPIIAKVETVEKIVQAIVCLHNWLRKQDINVNEYVPVHMLIILMIIIAIFLALGEPFLKTVPLIVKYE